MTKHNLTPRQKTFAEYCMLTHRFRSRTDAYIEVYKPKGSRRTAMASASRIYNKPAVQEYVDKLYEVEAQRAVDREEADHQAFLDSLHGRVG